MRNADPERFSQRAAPTQLNLTDGRRTRTCGNGTPDRFYVSLIMLAADSKDLAVAETQGQDTRWQFIVRALLHCPGREGVSVAATCRERRWPAGSQDASVRLLEFPSDRTGLIEWSSPTGYRYGQQIW